MRRLSGIFCFVILGMMVIALFLLPGNKSNNPSSVWDVLGTISLAAYGISSVVVFAEMVGEGNIPTPGVPAHKTALFFWVVTAIFTYLAVSAIEIHTGAPLTSLTIFILDGIIFWWPATVIGDWIYKHYYFKKQAE